MIKLNDQIINTSLKTAVINNSDPDQLFFELGNKPCAGHCQVVLAFYLDRSRKIREFISVIDAQDVYSTKGKNFYWSKTSRPDILKSKISVSDADCAEQVKCAMLKIVNKYK